MIIENLRDILVDHIELALKQNISVRRELSSSFRIIEDNFDSHFKDISRILDELM